ncbi:ABC transporter ATP-binding protein [Mycoplasmatota bacterium WC44]
MLSVNSLYAGYGKDMVLHDIDFTVSKGEVISIVGPNGCGKTTLLKAISNILKYEGEITFDECILNNLKRKELGKKIALLSQTSSSYFSYTIFDSVMLGRYPYLTGLLSTPRKKDIDIVNNALKRVGLYESKDKRIDELSGGQLQRVFLARTIAQEPDVILLDEPTNHLDFKYQVEILDFIRKWAKNENKIVIAVLHDLNLVQKYSDNVILLNEGKIVLEGKKEKVLSDELLKSVYEIDIKSWMKDVLTKWER